MNKLYYGDNLAVMKELQDDSIDLGNYPLTTRRYDDIVEASELLSMSYDDFFAGCSDMLSNHKRVLMPHLMKDYKKVLKCTCFLYESADNAKNGTKTGGSGFLVNVKSRTHYLRSYTYIVTNKHNIDGGATIVRLNTSSGVKVVEYKKEDWHWIENSYDIAVVPLILTDADVEQMQNHVVPIDSSTLLITEEKAKSLEIAPADDVFMVGRFVDCEGESRNEPSLRFGHISMMNAKIKQKNGFVPNDIVVDMHTRTGYSGSPVFVYRTAYNFLSPEHESQTQCFFYLLGIHRAQFPEIWQLTENNNKNNEFYENNMCYVKGFSGMSIVSPASAILDVLNLPALQKRRDKCDNILKPAGDILPEDCVSQEERKVIANKSVFDTIISQASKPLK